MLIMVINKRPIEMDENCQFYKDLTSMDNGNRNYNLGMWNLALSLRDLKLYTKGIKPHRRWKITPVKKYFGMTGNKEVLLEKLHRLNEIINEGE
tara:strand:- start:220 stop:501 length:282 start_codon:yes stop_codon:yes gene_type:complete